MDREAFERLLGPLAAHMHHTHLKRETLRRRRRMSSALRDRCEFLEQTLDPFLAVELAEQEQADDIGE